MQRRLSGVHLKYLRPFSVGSRSSSCRSCNDGIGSGYEPSTPLSGAHRLYHFDAASRAASDSRSVASENSESTNSPMSQARGDFEAWTGAMPDLRVESSSKAPPVDPVVARPAVVMPAEVELERHSGVPGMTGMVRLSSHSSDMACTTPARMRLKEAWLEVQQCYDERAEREGGSISDTASVRSLFSPDMTTSLDFSSPRAEASKNFWLNRSRALSAALDHLPPLRRW